MVVVVQTRPDQTRLPFHDGWRMFKEEGAAVEMNKKVEDLVK